MGTSLYYTISLWDVYLSPLPCWTQKHCKITVFVKMMNEQALSFPSLDLTCQLRFSHTGSPWPMTVKDLWWLKGITLINDPQPCSPWRGQTTMQVIKWSMEGLWSGRGPVQAQTHLLWDSQDLPHRETPHAMLAAPPHSPQTCFRPPTRSSHALYKSTKKTILFIWNIIF